MHGKQLTAPVYLSLDGEEEKAKLSLHADGGDPPPLPPIESDRPVFTAPLGCMSQAFAPFSSIFLLLLWQRRHKYQPRVVSSKTTPGCTHMFVYLIGNHSLGLLYKYILMYLLEMDWRIGSQLI